MPEVRLRSRRGDEVEEVSCTSVEEAIDLAARQIDSGEAWPVEVLVDGRVVLGQESLVEAARQLLGDDEEDDLT